MLDQQLYASNKSISFLIPSPHVSTLLVPLGALVASTAKKDG